MAQCTKIEFKLLKYLYIYRQKGSIISSPLKFPQLVGICITRFQIF